MTVLLNRNGRGSAIRVLIQAWIERESLWTRAVGQLADDLPEATFRAAYRLVVP
jgi:hypothetical protein